jgi:membrane-bound lytic murein transglycosylase D
LTFLIVPDRLECRWKIVVRSDPSRIQSVILIATMLATLGLAACSTLPNPGALPAPEIKSDTPSGVSKGVKPSLPGTTDSKAVDAKPANPKAAEAKPAEAKPADAKLTDSKSVESKPLDPKPSDSTGNPRATERDNDAMAEDSQAAVVIAPQKPLPDRDLWVRIRKGFALPALNSPLVAEKEKFYLQQPEYLDRMMTRGGRYLFHIVEEVEKRGLPTELALLPFVESAMNPVAMSSARASGLWQFMPATGKVFNLSQNWWVDDRRDVVHSTRAALDYLQKIHAMHGKDWFLALASYNWGEGAVGRAIRKNQARGRPGDYLSLDMPNETRHYIPKLMAIKNIIANASERGLALPAMPNKPYFVVIEKTRPIDLKLAAQFAGMSIDEFVALNPAHNRPVIAATKNNEIKLPADRLDAFVAAVTKHDLSKKTFASWQPYTIKDGETLDSVAQRGGVSVAELQKANSLKQSAKILPGTHLLAPQSRGVVDERKVESFVAPRVYEQVNNPAIHHTVGKKETLSSIARRYGVNAQNLSAMNSTKRVVRGTSLLVRAASSHTLLTTEHGQQQVIASKTALNKSAAERDEDRENASATVRKPTATEAATSAGRARSKVTNPVLKRAVRQPAARRVISARADKQTTRSVVGKSISRKLVKANSPRKPARG